MKKTILSAIACSLLMGVVSAKTWTSADGGKTFEGDYISHTDEFVIIKRGINKVKVKLDLLSGADRAWILEQKPAGASDPSTQGAVGSKIVAKSVILDGSKYVGFEPKKSADYYLIYFSASW